MRAVFYHDLAQYGLPFVTPRDPDYSGLIDELRRQWPVSDLNDEAFEDAAVLLNQSGKTVVATTVLWTYYPATGDSRSSIDASFASTAVFDEMGRNGSTLTAGSRRLITWQGTFGWNSDVKPPAVRSGPSLGWVFRRTPPRRDIEDVEGIEVQLDSAFFDDGLCVGPDQWGTFGGVLAAIAEERRLVDQILSRLRAGGTAVDVFAILRPLTIQRTPPPVSAAGLGPSLLHGFAFAAMHHVTHWDDQRLTDWFSEIAARQKLHLRRA